YTLKSLDRPAISWLEKKSAPEQSSASRAQDKQGATTNGSNSQRLARRVSAANQTGEAAMLCPCTTGVNEQAEPVFNAVCPSAVARQSYSAGRYSTTSRSNPDIALNFIGELIRRILRTPRSRRICEPAPTVL